eukprot:scaffold22135_cov57-Phaeocystis_antarctica.AAC.1
MPSATTAPMPALTSWLAHSSPFAAAVTRASMREARPEQGSHIRARVRSGLRRPHHLEAAQPGRGHLQPAVCERRYLDYLHHHTDQRGLASRLESIRGVAEVGRAARQQKVTEEAGHAERRAGGVERGEHVRVVRRGSRATARARAAGRGSARPRAAPEWSNAEELAAESAACVGGGSLEHPRQNRQARPRGKEALPTKAHFDHAAAPHPLARRRRCRLTGRGGRVRHGRQPAPALAPAPAQARERSRR